MDLKGKKVLIFQQRDWAIRIGHMLAKNLQAEGCELAALTFKKRTHTFVSTQTDVAYKHIVNIDDIFEHPENYLKNSDISLKDICHDLGIDSVWPYIYGNRLLSLSYKDKYYYSYKQNVSDEYMVAYIKAHYKVIKDLLEEFKPDLIIMAAYVYEGHILLRLLGEKLKIPNVTITDAKIPGYYIFTQDEFARKSALVERFNKLQAGEISASREKAVKYIKEFREKFKPQIYDDEVKGKEGLIRRLRHQLAPYKQIFDWYTLKKPHINNLENLGPTIDYRPPRIILRDFYAKKRYEKFAKKYKYYPLEKVGKFIFYPLKVSPEANTDLMSPIYNNQIELARQVAMSLPDDYTLVVKEHWAMIGLRTPSYLEKIDKLPNIKLVDYRIPSELLIKKADMIVSTFTTCFFEAVFYHKPAIMLADSGVFRLLPNIFYHTDLTTLSKKIKETLAINLDNVEYERQLENFISAVFDVGFDYNYNAAWERGKGDKNALWKLYKGEINRIFDKRRE